MICTKSNQLKLTTPPLPHPPLSPSLRKYICMCDAIGKCVCKHVGLYMMSMIASAHYLGFKTCVALGHTIIQTLPVVNVWLLPRLMNVSGAVLQGQKTTSTGRSAHRPLHLACGYILYLASMESHK